MDALLNHLPYATFQIGIRYLIMAGGAFFLCYILFRERLQWRKIQQKFPAVSDYRRDVFYSLVSIFIFAATSVWTFFVIHPYTNLYDNISDFGLPYYLFTFVWIFFLHDAYFYWAHRLMHHPRLFKIVHLTHHKSNNPSPWTAYAFHPLEALVESGIVTLAAFLLPMHRSAIIIYMVFQIAYNVYGHLGYEIFPANFQRNWFGRWLNTAVAHNMHHRFSTKNYGLWTLIWDRTFGTLHDQYDENYDRATQPIAQGSPV